MTTFTIGQLSKKTGVSVVAIRYYERIHLIPKANRRINGYRAYSSDFSEKIDCIKNLKSLGFSLKEIREFLELYNTTLPSSSVRSVISKKLQAIQEKINYLKKTGEVFESLLSKCDGSLPIASCPIVLYMKNPSQKKSI